MREGARRRDVAAAAGRRARARRRRRPRSPEGELLPRETRLALRAPTRAATTRSSGEVDDPAELVAAAGDRPVIAHDAKALGEVPANLVFDTEVAAYLLDPARRGYPLDELAEERGHRRRRPTTRRRRAPCSSTSSPRRQRAQLARARPRPTCCARSSCRSCACCARPRRPASSSTRAGSRRSRARIRADAAELEREIWELAGEEFMIGSPQQLAEVLFVKLGLSRKRRGKTGFSTDARVLQAIRDEHEIIPKIERCRELTKLAQTYLDALPDLRSAPTAACTRRSSRPPPPTGRLSSINPNLQNIPIRTETRPRDPRLLRRRAGQRAAVGRLLAGRAARARPHRRRGGAAGHLPARRGRPHRDRGARSSTLPPEQLDVGMRSKAKMVNYGIVYGLSAYGLADRLQIPQEEAQEFIDRYLERFPAVAQFMKDAVDAGRASTATCRRCSAAAARSPSSARATGRRASSASGSRSTRSSRAPRRTSSRWRWSAATTRSPTPGLQTRMILQIHDELLFEGPAEETERATEIVAREMVGAAELDPPLAVDAGVGPNWLDAK